MAEQYDADTMWDYIVSHGLGIPTDTAMELAQEAWLHTEGFKGDYAAVAMQVVSAPGLLLEQDEE